MGMLSDLVFPKKCLACHLPGQYLCLKCRQKMIVCHETIYSGGNQKTNLNGMIAIWRYRGLAREVIKEFKYRFIQGMIKEVAGLAVNQLWQQRKERYLKFWQFIVKKPIIIPIPLHSSRHNWRGFNQAEVLAKELAKIWQLPYTAKILRRIKSTRPQVELKGKERKENIKGVFSLSDELKDKGKILRGQDFLLVDDVITTGATIREAGKVLKKAGAAKVWGLALAR